MMEKPSLLDKEHVIRLIIRHRSDLNEASGLISCEALKRWCDTYHRIEFLLWKPKLAMPVEHNIQADTRYHQ